MNPGDENDDKPRRNLIAMSIAIILYVLGDGTVAEKSSYGLAGLHFGKPWVIESAAIVIFTYFIWSYWVSHVGAITVFGRIIRRDITKLRAYRMELTMRFSNLSAEYGDAAEGHMNSVLVALRHPNNDSSWPLPERSGFLEREAKYTLSYRKETDGDVNRIDLSIPLNPDKYMCLWGRSFVRRMLFLPEFRDTILPYAFALIAVMVMLFS